MTKRWLVQKVLPSTLQGGTKIETSEVIANCFENETPGTTKVFSVSDESEITPKILLATNPKKQVNEVVSGYPSVQSKNSIKLKITKIDEWDNFIEAVITGETEDEESITFFDTNYFLHKESYKIGEIYNFTISALGYDVEMLDEKSFSFEGQKAKDWLAKIGREPTYDERGNVEPVVFYLNELVAFLQTGDDATFQSPIKSVETIRAFDKDFYKFKITILRDPDVEIYLYAKTDFFDRKPGLGDALRGIIWLQGKKDDQ